MGGIYVLNNEKIYIFTEDWFSLNKYYNLRQMGFIILHYIQTSDLLYKSSKKWERWVIKQGG